MQRRFPLTPTLSPQGSGSAPSRRDVLLLTAGAVVAGVASSAAAQDAERHGMSAFGDLAYPADFTNFKYVNPDAPRGGMFSQIGPNRQYNQSFQTFNSLNSYILKGDGAQGMELTFATLMVRSGDEPDAMYGLAARGVAISADGLIYRFSLRPEAKFHDGTPLTAQDVVWTLTTLKAMGHPIITQLLRDFTGAEAADDHTVVVRFAAKRGRDVPLFAASLPIFSTRLLRGAAIRPIDPQGAARQRRLQGRPLRARPFYRIYAGQRLVGRQPAGCARAEQFRRRAL